MQHPMIMQTYSDERAYAVHAVTVFTSHLIEHFMVLLLFHAYVAVICMFHLWRHNYIRRRRCWWWWCWCWCWWWLAWHKYGLWFTWTVVLVSEVDNWRGFSFHEEAVEALLIHDGEKIILCKVINIMMYDELIMFQFYCFILVFFYLFILDGG